MTIMVQHFRLRHIVETGTHLGNTAFFFARQFPELTIWTCEINKTFYRASRNRLRGIRNVRIFNLDSESFLRQILPGLGEGRLYWLDAHWYEDVPLLMELAVIDEDNRPGVVVIDDFFVPNQPQFGFDDYGDGHRIDRAYIRTYVESRRPWLLLPKYGVREPRIKAQLRGHAILLQNIPDPLMVAFSHDQSVERSYTIEAPGRQ